MLTFYLFTELYSRNLPEYLIEACHMYVLGMSIGLKAPSVIKRLKAFMILSNWSLLVSSTCYLLSYQFFDGVYIQYLLWKMEGNLSGLEICE